MEGRYDFLEWLGPDTSSCVLMRLDEPADLARASAVSRSWRRFVIGNDFSKMLCLRICPEVSHFNRIEVSSSETVEEDVGSSTAAEWENQMREHRVYMHLSHGILTPKSSTECIVHCISASSTDNFPEESIENTLEPSDRVETRPSYWSSGGQSDPSVPECLIYRLGSDLCLIDEIKIQPFKAFFQFGHPIYSARYVRFRMGHSKLPIGAETFVSEENEGQLTADDNYVWTYTSPKFPMSQESILQSFKLPRPVLCIGGVVKIELLGRVQKQAMDGLYYICVCHVQVLGNPVSPELAVHPSERGTVLKYFPDARAVVPSGDLSADEARGSSRWHSFAARIRHLGASRGWNQALLNRLFGPVQFADEDELSDEEAEELL